MDRVDDQGERRNRRPDRWLAGWSRCVPSSHCRTRAHAHELCRGEPPSLTSPPRVHLAVGVLVGNPFEVRTLSPGSLHAQQLTRSPVLQVLKVRLQTAPSSTSTPSSSSPRVGKSSVSPLRSPSFPFPPPPTPLGRSAAPAPLPAAASPAQHSPSTLRTPGPAALGASTVPSAAPASAPHAPHPAPHGSTSASAARPGLISLYRTEGFRFFFAGTAGPILGLAFIDSAFFGLYGRMM